MAYAVINFDEKHDGDVDETLQPTVLEYAQILCKNGAQSNQKWCYCFDGFEFSDLETPLRAVSSESNKFYKMYEKTSLL